VRSRTSRCLQQAALIEAQSSPHADGPPVEHGRPMPCWTGAGALGALFFEAADADGMHGRNPPGMYLMG